MVEDPVLKVTLPEAGVPDPGVLPATVAVYVTVWPTTDENTEVVRMVVVLALRQTGRAAPSRQHPGRARLTAISGRIHRERRTEKLPGQA